MIDSMEHYNNLCIKGLSLLALKFKEYQNFTYQCFIEYKSFLKALKAEVLIIFVQI